ncbi:TonB-dependent receptor [Chryseolinea sp. T2]|uniref:TonB-dependent receptor domain-containing protein n=1 Tax=Chryseolinea sp. T2 TaxID=3129255 RepID=UPI0030786B78
MKTTTRSLIAALFLFGMHLSAISVLAQGKFNVTGKVLDSLNKAPLAFATVRVINAENNALVNGAITTDDGSFKIDLQAGRYVAEIDFMGYQSYRSNSFTLSREHDEHNIGSVLLSSSSRTLDEVVIQAEKSSMELALDKRIFNVGQDLANRGGTATDILMNVPSVSVDPEGGVRLRGSDNVRILIDGKPSGLVSFKGGSGLQQLQASMIERVEVITNPSARYEAEGMAGIINIVLKKDNSQGFNGSFEVITGHPVNYGAAANVNFRHRKVNFFVNYSIAYREQPGVGHQYQEAYDQGYTHVTEQSSKAYITGFNNSIRGGIDFFFSEKSVLTGSYLWRRSDASRVTNIHYDDFLNPGNIAIGSTDRRQDEDEIEPNSEYSLIYKRSFSRKGHELTGEIKFLDNWESSNQLFTTKIYPADETADSETVETSLNDEYEKQFLVQLDYVQPFAKDGKFETGVRTSFRDMENDYIVSRKNDSGGYDPLPGLDNVFLYDENIHAAYGIVGNKTGKFSYQAGLRAEWTDVKTTLVETNEVNPRKYANLFPSAHATLDLPSQNAIQVSYSRRVRRPFYNDLSPFMTFSDNRNFFSGNPDLNPEFTDVFEVGHIKYFEIGTLTSSVYYRDTDDKIQSIRTVDPTTGFARTMPRNLKGEKSYGIEFVSNLNPVKWWKVDLNFNFFHSNVDGSNIDESYKRTTYSWFARATNRFTLPKGFDAQVRANYEAPQKTAQGERKELYYFDLSFSKDILKGRGTLNLNVLDLFNTRRMRTVTEGEDFYTYNNSQFRRRQINLTFSYRIKQAKSAKRVLSEE